MLYVVTRATTVRVPDFAWAGMQLSSGSIVNAAVSAVGRFGSMDELAAGPVAVLPRAQAYWAANGMPPVDGFATRYRMTVRMR